MLFHWVLSGSPSSTCCLFKTYRGKASKNANFEALPEDWRERIKKRKLMNNT